MKQHPTAMFTATACGLVWQPRSLLSAIPEVTALATPENVVANVLKRSLSVLSADTASLSLYDARSRRYRVIAVASAQAAEPLRWPPVLQEIPLDFVSTRANATLDRTISEVLVLPEDEPEHPVASLLVALDSTALYVALRSGDVVVGAMNVLRPAALVFTAGDRHLARSVADQATLVITTVRVV